MNLTHEVKISFNDRIKIINDKKPIIFKNKYDDNQYWLSFATNIILTEKIINENDVEEIWTDDKIKKEFNKRKKRKYYPCPDRSMYFFESNQKVLPFREFRRISKTEIDRLSSYRTISAWDLTEKKCLHKINLKYNKYRNEIQDYMASNDAGLYYYNNYSELFIEREDTYTFLMLTFS